MQGKKTSIETKAKIIEAKINTDWSSRDIEASTWIPHETVAKVLREDFTQVCTESERIAKLIDRNNNLQGAGDALIAEMIDTKADGITIAQLTGLRTSTFTQNQLLTGKVTERVEVLDYSKLSPKELEEEKNKHL